MGSNLINLFSPGIVRYVESVLTEGRVGVCSGAIRIKDITTGCSSLAKSPCADRFRLIIPYAGHSVTWEVLFNSSIPDEPPDFIFGDTNFLPDIENVQSLVNWEPADPKGLIYVVNELLDEYKKYQQSVLQHISRMQFEYTSLLEVLEASKVEVYVMHRTERQVGPINFLIRLPVDFSRIPTYLTKDNPGEDAAVLLVTYETADGTKVTPQLFLSPRVEHCLGGATMLRIPHLPPSNCLIDYVPTVCELITNTVDQVVASFEKRQEYVATFLGHFGRCVVEYDVEAFGKISFLMEWHDFFFLITIDLPRLFPAQCPVFVFQSVYHEAVDGQPYSKVVSDYPYSPRWTPREMAERARAYILDQIAAFQKGSVTQGSLQQ
ncbi:BRISC and BRCA1-A complex member 2 [Lamellibrachia satsuma]|nr:BRISC and BRCA1-A complex member 2 [Lamellibrachia satsuma]